MNMQNPQLITILQEHIQNDIESERAKNYLEQIHNKEQFLANTNHPIYFIGPIGVGKSSLIAIASNLLLGSAPPRNRQELRKQSVLATGSGRTTVCEVQIQKTQSETDPMKLSIEPLSRERMEDEINEYAQDVWQLVHNDEANIYAENSSDGQEIQRFIRNMCGYQDVTENTYTDGVRKRRAIRPFEETAKNFPDEKQFCLHMLEKAQLDKRQRTEWEFDGEKYSCMQGLQELFNQLNQGTCDEAMLPTCITLHVPETFPSKNKNIDVSWVDTRGLDGGIESRADLQKCLSDPRGLFVFCTSFNDAPNESIRAVLRAVQSNRQLQPSLARSLLVLVDVDNSASVNGSDGDRELGQSLKIDECFNALRPLNLVDFIEFGQIIAFDVLQDEQSSLIAQLERGILDLRHHKETELQDLINEANLFLTHVKDTRRTELVKEIDKQLQIALEQHFINIGTDSILEAPLSSPINGMLSSISESRYASRVRASCRRGGMFPSLDLYAATHFHAAQQTSEWLTSLLEPIWMTLDRFASDTNLEYGKDLIDSKRREIEKAENEVIKEYADRVRDEMKTLLLQPVRDQDRDSLAYKTWLKCISEWGQGDGFKDRVISHLQSWANKQVFRAHERTKAKDLLPFLADIKLPQESKDFVLRIENLRALKQIEWSPHEICLLIGENGAGKSTLLLCLRLLNLAFKSDLSQAVRNLFGGSHNLRHWRANEQESIEISLQLNGSVWKFNLQPGEGSVDTRTRELFTHNGNILFTRDSLGITQFQGKIVQAGEKTALRAILEQGEKHPELKKFERLLLGIRLLHDPDLYSLRKNGSFVKDDLHLFTRGENALTILRSWMQNQQQRYRFDFVLDGLRDAFPKQLKDLDFNDNGTTLVARIYNPQQPDRPIPLESQPNGVLQLLILLTALASADERSILAIDEPENCLHPYALKSFIRQAKFWAKRYNLTIILATHSIALLNIFSETPEQVFVMKSKEGEESIPTRLDHLYDEEWLSCFQLGELFEREELVSNGDE